MPYINDGALKLHYTDAAPSEQAPAIITLHGLSESHLYWSLTGMTDRLYQAGYRVISMDMRGHGFTEVSGPQKGYNVATLCNDIETLANQLGLEQFHLLTHATGGIVSFQYAAQNPQRVLSLLATNTGSATYPIDQFCEIDDPAYEFPPLSEKDQKRNRALANAFRGAPWGNICSANRATALHNPFLNCLPNTANPEQAFALYFACSAIGNPENFADFIDEFYTSYDPHIASLQKIQCPTLMLVGEHDRMFIKPAELVARHVKNCTHCIMENTGHMTAIENPTRLAESLFDFLRAHNL